MRHFRHARSACRSLYSISHQRQKPQSLPKAHFPHTPKGEELGRSTLQSPYVSSKQAQWHHLTKPIAIASHPSVPARLHKQHQYMPYEHHQRQSPAFHTREQCPRAIRYEARHSDDEKLSPWVIFRDCFSRKNNLSCISKRPPRGEAQPGMPGKTSLALMTSLAQKLTMLLLGHACTTLLDDRSHDGPPIDRSLQLRVNRIVSYNFFPTLGRARASQGDNLKKFSRLSVPHHSGNCW